MDKLKKIDFVNILNIDDLNIVNNNDSVIITGVTGQDGSLMVEYLINNTNLNIFGGVRRLSVYNHDNIRHIENERFKIINFDLTDNNCISNIISKIKPKYFINFAAQSYVGCSWDFAYQTFSVNTMSIINILDSIKRFCPNCRLYQAGSSEEFGNVNYSPQDELHPLKPRSPYGASKVSSRHIIKVYRESYNLYCVQGWLFNHEGTRRGEDFVTRKITKKVAEINKCINNNMEFNPIELGNINSSRDWSDAEDFIDGVWKMLNQDVIRDDYNNDPREYVLSSNETHTIREFVELAFKNINIVGFWEGKDLDEKFLYLNKLNEKKILVKINQRFYRPAEVDLLYGDSQKVRNELHWLPKTNFNDLVKKMVLNDINLLN